MTATKFISELVLPHPDEYKNLNNSIVTIDEELVKSATLHKNISAQINGGSICIFDSILTNQEKDDIKNSILLAQLAADKKYNRFSESKDWYRFYFSVFANIGWNQLQFSNVNNKTTIVDWSNLVIDSMHSIATQHEISLALKGMKAWQYLPSNGKGIMLWNKHTINKNNENFQIISVNKSNNDVTMVISAIDSKSTKTPNEFLSWATKYSIDINNSRSNLNKSVYNQVRQIISAKLKNYQKTFVVNLPLKNLCYTNFKL